MPISTRARLMVPSPTLSLNALVLSLISSGKSVINLTSGQLDTQTPDNVKLAGIKAIIENKSRYTPVPGIPELRQAVADKFVRDNGIPCKSDQVVVGVGAKQLLYNYFQVVCNPVDEVVVSTPTWSTYIEQIKLAGAIPVTIELDAPFVLTAERISRVLTSKTKVLLLNSPSNPTGAVIPKGELKKIADLVVSKGLQVVSDEIYESLVYGEPHVSIASLGIKIANRTVTINGVSKSYAMTGWRIGYAMGSKQIISKMSALQSQSTSNATAIAQYAALEALTGPQDSVAEVRELLSERRNYLFSEIPKIKGLELDMPQGAFYLFVSIKKLLGKKYLSSDSWCEDLLKKKGVAVVSGEAFLAPGYFRLSFAASLEELILAVAKIKEFVYAK